jgi:hypothetical protein
MTTTPCPAPAHEPGPSARRALAAGALAGLFLAACGGDSGSPVPPPPPPPAITQVPVSAAVDDASWEAFAIAQAPTEDREPLTLELVTSVPSSEIEEPIVLP